MFNDAHRPVCAAANSFVVVCLCVCGCVFVVVWLCVCGCGCVFGCVLVVVCLCLCVCGCVCVVVCLWLCGCVVVVVCLWLWLPSAARDEALPAESVEAVRKLASDLRCPLLYAEDQVSFTATPTHQPVSHTVDVSFHQ